MDTSQIESEIFAGGGIGLAAAAALLPGRIEGRSIDPITITRWCSNGIMLPNGERVFLEHVKVGRTIKTTVPALKRFVSATSSRQITAAAEMPRSAAERSRAVVAAERELELRGV